MSIAAETGSSSYAITITAEDSYELPTVCHASSDSQFDSLTCESDRRRTPSSEWRSQVPRQQMSELPKQSIAEKLLKACLQGGRHS
jgi:hypothetical protein